MVRTVHFAVRSCHEGFAAGVVGGRLAVIYAAMANRVHCVHGVCNAGDGGWRTPIARHWTQRLVAVAFLSAGGSAHFDIGFAIQTICLFLERK